MSINICDLCYTMERPTCQDEITLDFGLTPATEYTLFVRDKFDHDYTQTITSDGSGLLVVDMTAFPEGMFTEFSGSYELSVSLDETVSTHETITIGGSDYLCVILSFKALD